jgi:hypothetical protein
VGSFKPTASDLSFLGHLVGDNLDKVAVELEPRTKNLLGIGTETPDVLDQLEGAAGSAGDSAPDRGAHAENPPPTPGGHDPGRASQAPPAGEEVSEYEEAPPQGAAPPEPAVTTDIGEPAYADAEPDAVDDESLPVPETPTRAGQGKIFSGRRTHPLRLFDVLMAKYRDAWIHWEPETLWWAIRRDFGPVGEVTRNKIEAVRTALLTSRPWDEWDVFEKCGVAWNDLMPIFGAYQPMSPSQLAFAVHVAHSLEPDMAFSPEVCAYMAAVLDDAGFVYAPPDWFPDEVQLLLDRKAWTVATKVNVVALWEKVQHVDPSGIDWNQDNHLDVQVAKLMAIREYLRAREQVRVGDPREESMSRVEQAADRVSGDT